MFTPRELLQYTALFKTNHGEKEVARQVDVLLEVVGLTLTADVPCSVLTGGQLKRVSIAKGLVAQPKVLFLDEPTTYVLLNNGCDDCL